MSMNIIVSLTTTRQRLELSRYTIESLFRQTIQPDSVWLNVSENAYLFDEGIGNIPDWLIDFQNHGLTLNWVENIGPYRKLIPILESIKENGVIVTCDDDCIYHSDWLKYLIEGAKRYPGEIVCGRARLIAENRSGKPKSYIYWPKVSSDQTGMNFIPIGYAGVVYRKNLLDINFIENRVFLQLAPKQDDIWFRAASRIKGIRVRVVTAADKQVYPFGRGRALSDANTSFYKYGKENPLLAIKERFKKYIYGYFGKDLCENDVVYKNVINYINSH